MFSRTLPDDTLELHTLHQLFAVSNLEEANINTTIYLKKLTCAHKGYGISTVAVADVTKVGDIWLPLRSHGVTYHGHSAKIFVEEFEIFYSATEDCIL
jgi:hypothetical protein